MPDDILYNSPSNLTTGNIIDVDASLNVDLGTSDEFRKQLMSRSLYGFEEYGIDNNKLKKQLANGVSLSLTSILATVPSFPKFDNLITRQFDALGYKSPLTEIGTVMYGKQMMYNMSSHISSEIVPTIDLSKALQLKNPVTLPKDFSITNLQNVNDLDAILSRLFFKTNTFGSVNPFGESNTNEDYLENTGKRQLQLFYKNIGENYYKEVDNDDTYRLKYYAKQSNSDITLQSSFISNKIYYSFDNKKSYPYFKKYINLDDSVDIANNSIRESYNVNNTAISQLYAPDNDYVDNYLGINEIVKTYSINNKVNDDNDDNNINKIVWGRDGIKKVDNSDLRGTDDNVSILSTYESEQGVKSKYNIYRGLLEYTRNLLNASNGYFVDITRKAFKLEDGNYGYNGSPLWTANNSNYSRASDIAGKNGIRQHTILDQYNKFAKAIRFKGNYVYNGNSNSVINESVIPKIHPIRINGGKEIDVKNLMFSIENLAIQVVSNGEYGIINDENGSPIPLSEVGPFQGRIMWFPPYDLQLNETALAKYDSTVMIGRSEPIYSYMNSERTATLSFTLLIDHPPHLLSKINDPNYNRNISDFFAFGGNALPTEYNIKNVEKQIYDKEKQLAELKGPTAKNQSNEIITIEDIGVYFPNNVPLEGNENNVFNEMYNNLHYEIINGCESAQDGNGYGLNNKIFYLIGLNELSKGKFILNTSEYYNQYIVGREPDQFGNINFLNSKLIQLFDNEENRKLYTIRIEGRASKLNQNSSDNKKLAERRANAVKFLIEQRLIKLFGNIKDFNNITTRVIDNGVSYATEEGLKSENISLREVKEDRVAIIRFERTGKLLTSNVINENDEKIKGIQNEINSLNVLLDRLKNLRDNVYNKRNFESTAIFKNYEPFEKNLYHPIYNSQTPEDFHKRLTFLQQCTRQGSAMNKNTVNDENNLTAKNSVFGRQPICILRVGDFFYTKVIIDNVTIDYNDTTWDMNPEGFGMQPMIAKVTLQMKILGGQSLKGPIDALQNAVSFNYYGNSTYSNVGLYEKATKAETEQASYINGILVESKENFEKKYNDKFKK